MVGTYGRVPCEVLFHHLFSIAYPLLQDLHSALASVSSSCHQSPRISQEGKTHKPPDSLLPRLAVLPPRRHLVLAPPACDPLEVHPLRVGLGRAVKRDEAELFVGRPHLDGVLVLSLLWVGRGGRCRGMRSVVLTNKSKNRRLFSRDVGDGPAVTNQRNGAGSEARQVKINHPCLSKTTGYLGRNTSLAAWCKQVI